MAAADTPDSTRGSPGAADLGRRIIGLLNLYRLLLPPVLLLIRMVTSPQPTLGAEHPRLFTALCVLYLAAGIMLVLAVRSRRWPLRNVALFGGLTDAIAIPALMYASGGVVSGLGILLVLPVGATALLLADNRTAFFIAATATVAVLVQQLLGDLSGTASSLDYPAAGVLGAIVFLIALGAWPVANRLRESEALVQRQEVDLANLAQLSQYIVQHLRESILVVDSDDRIRLINESAAMILGDRRAYPGELLGEASPRLLYLLSTWRQSAQQQTDTTGTFIASDGARVIEPHFAPLGSDDPAPVLVFLEDTSTLAGRVQQAKLAALGRLSASIAHEIRNPVGAMSHAAQLLAESTALRPEDKRLTEIITNNGERVSTIINNVMSMSRRESNRPERLLLRAWLATFSEEFCATMQWSAARLRIEDVDNEDIEIRVDPTQLRQVIWNLCDNAIKYGLGDAEHGAIEIRFGRLKPSARPFLEVADRGPGIATDNAERIFEPFFSGEQRSSGLGLFLARELAEANFATLLYEPRTGGGTLFRLVFSDPQRWEI